MSGLLLVLLPFIIVLLVTPLVKKLAIRIGAIDKPNERKVHQKIMPRLGGLAIFIGFIMTYLLSDVVKSDKSIYVLIGSLIIITIGILDDKFELSAKTKFIGQLIAAFVVVVLGDLGFMLLNIPFIDEVYLGYFSIPLSILWIVGVTNAINLIDGLDGLAAGVSSIALGTICVMAFMSGNTFVGILSLILLSSTLGFLVYNFHPASIFMGDTGALFLGFMISVLSLLELKNITFFSLIIPVVILAVPISDTFFAIIRRIVNRKPLSAPDKSHLHHCLLGLGFSHRETVLIVYCLSLCFSIAALIISRNVLWDSILVITVLLLLIELGVEKIGLISKEYKPILKVFKKLKFKAELTKK